MAMVFQSVMKKSHFSHGKDERGRTLSLYKYMTIGRQTKLTERVLVQQVQMKLLARINAHRHLLKQCFTAGYIIKLDNSITLFVTLSTTPSSSY